MAEYIRIGPFLATFITLAFIFSTMFTLAFYYYQGANASYGSQVMVDSTTHPALGVIGILSGILDFISWLSPFALVKGFLIYVMAGTPDLYQVIDMLLLRPIGWIIVFVEANFLISKIPTISGE